MAREVCKPCSWKMRRCCPFPCRWMVVKVRSSCFTNAKILGWKVLANGAKRLLRQDSITTIESKFILITESNHNPGRVNIHIVLYVISKNLCQCWHDHWVGQLVAWIKPRCFARISQCSHTLGKYTDSEERMFKSDLNMIYWIKLFEIRSRTEEF